MVETQNGSQKGGDILADIKLSTRVSKELKERFAGIAFIAGMTESEFLRDIVTREVEGKGGRVFRVTMTEDEYFRFKNMEMLE